MNEHHQALINLLKNHFQGKEITGIEIGTFRGELALDILPACPNISMLYTIDPYQHIEGGKFEMGLSQETLDNNKEIAFRNLVNFGNRIIILYLPSDSAYYLINDMVDFVWIDGDHSPDQIAKDFKFERLVKSGGFIGGHDFGIFAPMTEIVKLKYKGKIKTGIDSIWWVEK